MLLSAKPEEILLPFCIGNETDVKKIEWKILRDPLLTVPRFRTEYLVQPPLLRNDSIFRDVITVLIEIFTDIALRSHGLKDPETSTLKRLLDRI